ncbi:MAG: EFR1 family ferrodoxin [Sporomusaceae bacterium]|nr:EFR1 family ferrodoxin [Sporomusaceae bacterium]
MAIKAVYFSPTGTTKKIILGIAEALAGSIGGAVHRFDITLPDSRRHPATFSAGDIVVLGVPVYAGRVPNILLKYLNSLAGNGATAVAVALYGNRNYDDALIELADILSSTGFKVIAGGAFIGEHAFSKTLAQNRPDDKDMAIVREFAGSLSMKIAAGNTANVAVKGNRPYRKYYMPENENGQPVDIRKVTPKTADHCIDCKFCAAKCPMGSIDPDNVSRISGICIKCGACQKLCPVQAKYYDNDDYLRHKQELERDFALRREPELFL